MCRDAMTGRIIKPHDEAILVENIVPYAKKLGYLISNIRFALIGIFFIQLKGGLS